MRCHTTSTVILVALFAATTSAATVVHIVSPAGLEDVEGNSVISPYQHPNPSVPDPPPNVLGYRAHHLFQSNLFQSLGPGPFLITAMSGRPDISVNEALTAVWQETWKLTTTPRSSLTTTFAANFGTEPIEQVYSGNVTYETDGVPRGGGLPHEFGFGVGEFDVPYIYYPQQGNLLAEFTSSTLFDGSNWIWLDFQETQVTGQFMQGGGEQATSGFFLPGQAVFQLTVTIPLPGDYNIDGVVDAADYTVWRDRLGQDVTLPNETVTPGHVTPEDYDEWVAHFGATAGGAAHALTTTNGIPEPTTLLLAATASLGLWLRHHKTRTIKTLERR